MNKAYNPIDWRNEPNTSTPINETNLNKMDRAIDTIDDRVIDLDNGKVNKEEGKSLVSNTDISKIRANETAIQTHISDKSNPHSVTKAQVGLGNVDNTRDADKPISTEQQAEFDAINNKIDSNVNTINNNLDNQIKNGYLGKNLIDIEDITLSTSGYVFDIPCDIKSGTYTFSFDFSGTNTQGQIAFRDSNVNNIVAPTFQVLSGRNSITVTINKTANMFAFYSGVGSYSKVQLEAGTEKTDYVPFVYPNTKIGELNDSLDGLENDVLTLQDVSLKGGVYAGDDGNFINLNNYMCSNDFIEITPNTHFKLLLNEDNDDYGLLLYDKDKNYLGRSNSFLYTSGNLIEGITPQNAYYATINIHLYNGNFPTVYLYTTKIGKVVNQLKNDLSEKLKVISVSLSDVMVSAMSSTTVDLPQEYIDAGYVIANILTDPGSNTLSYKTNSATSFLINNTDRSAVAFAPTATVTLLIAKIG